MGDAHIVPFGKYRGQPIEVLAQDASYRDWLMAQPWFGERFPNLRTIVINNFAAPDETPEHNELQARFLNHEWAQKFVTDVHFDGDVAFAAEFHRKRMGADATAPWSLECHEVSFEDKGADVVLVTKMKIGSMCVERTVLRIECKPTMGDDYPAVLRQMKASKCGVLLIGDGGYTGRGASLDQVCDIFGRSGIFVILTSDLKVEA